MNNADRDSQLQFKPLASLAEPCDVHSDALTQCANERGHSVQNITSEIFSLPSGDINDIILDTGDKLFHCHKQVLCKGSLYFQGMFMSGMQESQATCIQLRDTKTEAFRVLLQYFYTGQLELSQSNVCDLTQVSSLYQAMEVLQKCSDFLQDYIDDDSCLNLMHLADTFMLTELYDHCRRHCLWHFENVSRTDDFYVASASQVIDYLQDTYLNCESEVDVFRACAEWYSQKPKPCEVTDLSDFFTKAVNFHLLTEEAVVCLKDLPTVQMNKELQEFVTSLSHKDHLSSLKSKTSGRRRVSPRDCRILCFGAHQCELTKCGDDCSIMRWQTAPLEILEFRVNRCQVEVFNTMGNILPTLAVDSGYRVCAVGSKVFVCGGEATFGRDAWLMTVWCFDTQQGSWQEAGTLCQPRRHHGICCSGTLLFLIGGIGRYRIRLRSMESFNTITGEWTSYPDMLQSETSPAAVACKGRIYVMKNYVQVFDMVLHTWSYLELSPGIPGHPLCTHTNQEGQKIYVSCLGSKSLWQLDLQQMTVHHVCEFQQEGSGGVYHQGNMLHFSMLDNKDHAVMMVESYNIKESRHHVIGTLSNALLMRHFVTVPYFPHFTPSSKQAQV